MKHTITLDEESEAVAKAIMERAGIKRWTDLVRFLVGQQERRQREADVLAKQKADGRPDDDDVGSLGMSRIIRNRENRA